jgi:hypothetical protein
MGHSLQYLAYLVHTKNNLNRKRRRFSAIMNNRTGHEYDFKNNLFKRGRYIRHKSFTKKFAVQMYKQCKRDMKAMTKEMRTIRTEIGARFAWSDHGAISWIVLENKKYLPKEIERLAECYLADEILLADHNYEK